MDTAKEDKASLQHNQGRDGRILFNPLDEGDDLKFKEGINPPLKKSEEQAEKPVTYNETTAAINRILSHYDDGNDEELSDAEIGKLAMKVQKWRKQQKEGFPLRKKLNCGFYAIMLIVLVYVLRTQYHVDTSEWLGF